MRATLIELKRGQVVALPSRHGDAILTNDSQIPRPALCAYAAGWRRRARQSPSRHCRKLSINFRATQEKRRFLKPRFV